MLKKERAKQLQDVSKHNLSINLILRRMREKWSDRRIIDTPPLKKPLKTHPLKSASYEAMLERLGRDK